tara:strand:- start:7539 stop:7703 length:165 start_codon:yes stop_codon:yes gene_type:complete
MSDDKKVVDVVVKIKGISLFGENKSKEKENISDSDDKKKNPKKEKIELNQEDIT